MSKKHIKTQSEQLQDDQFNRTYPIFGKGSISPEWGNYPIETPTKEQKRDKDERTRDDKNIIKALIIQVGFNGTEYQHVVFLDANSHLWPKLPKRRKDSKEPSKKSDTVVM